MTRKGPTDSMPCCMERSTERVRTPSSSGCPGHEIEHGRQQPGLAAPDRAGILKHGEKFPVAGQVDPKRAQGPQVAVERQRARARDVERRPCNAQVLDVDGAAGLAPGVEFRDEVARTRQGAPPAQRRRGAVEAASERQVDSGRKRDAVGGERHAGSVRVAGIDEGRQARRRHVTAAVAPRCREVVQRSAQTTQPAAGRLGDNAPGRHGEVDRPGTPRRADRHDLIGRQVEGPDRGPPGAGAHDQAGTGPCRPGEPAAPRGPGLRQVDFEGERKSPDGQAVMASRPCRARRPRRPCVEMSGGPRGQDMPQARVERGGRRDRRQGEPGPAQPPAARGLRQRAARRAPGAGQRGFRPTSARRAARAAAS